MTPAQIGIAIMIEVGIGMAICIMVGKWNGVFIGACIWMGIAICKGHGGTDGWDGEFGRYMDGGLRFGSGYGSFLLL